MAFINNTYKPTNRRNQLNIFYIFLTDNSTILFDNITFTLIKNYQIGNLIKYISNINNKFGIINIRYSNIMNLISEFTGLYQN